MARPLSSKLLQEYLDAAVEMARAGGVCLLEGWKEAKQISFKGSIDLVTPVDLKSQRVILEGIRQKFPRHSILAEEEGGLLHGQAAEKWIVDPLDGTTNFAHCFPFICVSIALEIEGELVVGVIYNPIMEELFCAARGEGAFLNRQPIKVSGQTRLQHSLLATGFPYDIADNKDQVMARFSNMLLSAQGVRRPGSAALDLCYVACGIFDGFWEQGLKPWDVAAGVVIVEEAGGVVSDFSGRPVDIYKPEILASNGLIHQQMLERLDARAHDSDRPRPG